MFHRIAFDGLQSFLDALSLSRPKQHINIADVRQFTEYILDVVDTDKTGTTSQEYVFVGVKLFERLIWHRAQRC